MTSGFLHRNIWVFIVTGLLVVAGTAVSLTQLANSRQLADQQARIDQLTSQLDTARADEQSLADTTVKLSMGVEASRLDTDSTIIRSLLSTAATWDSGEAYDAARQSLMDRYGLSETSAFLTSVMPAQNYRVDAEGKSYYYIDAMGLSSSLDSVHIDLVDAKADAYTYVVRMRLDVANPNITGSSAVSDYLIQVTVDGSGRISGLSGVAGSGVQAHSN